MLIFSKAKILIALGTLFGGVMITSLLLSNESGKPNYLDLDGKVDYITDNMCNIKNGKADLKNELVSINRYKFKIDKNLSLYLHELKDFSTIDLSNKSEIYQSNEWKIFTREMEFDSFQKAEFKRSNTLPPEFIKVVEYAKSYMNKLYNIDKISLKNVIHKVGSYDIENERLRILTNIRIDFFYDGTMIDDRDDRKYLFIDVSFDDMKKITTRPKYVAYTFHLLLEQAEKGGFKDNRHIKSSYALKAVSPKVNVIKESLEDFNLYNDVCGAYTKTSLYHDNDRAKPLSKGMLGTIKVKNPRLCDYHHTNCKELSISNSF